MSNNQPDILQLPRSLDPEVWGHLETWTPDPDQLITPAQCNDLPEDAKTRYIGIVTRWRDEGFGIAKYGVPDRVDYAQSTGDAIWDYMLRKGTVGVRAAEKLVEINQRLRNHIGEPILQVQFNGRRPAIFNFEAKLALNAKGSIKLPQGGMGEIMIDLPQGDVAHLFAGGVGFGRYVDSPGEVQNGAPMYLYESQTYTEPDEDIQKVIDSEDRAQLLLIGDAEIDSWLDRHTDVRLGKTEPYVLVYNALARSLDLPEKALPKRSKLVASIHARALQKLLSTPYFENRPFPLDWVWQKN